MDRIYSNTHKIFSSKGVEDVFFSSCSHTLKGLNNFAGEESHFGGGGAQKVPG